ncbi:rna-directed dna polymerase from mobile element jockey-like [Pitangus sulphuratus]|nr:rna-directed dna polymerase from mobile element jockey-like [Pitangus sulphuratus]
MTLILSLPARINRVKRHRHRFDGWTTWWIKYWLDGHSQRVPVNISISKWKAVTSGIPWELVLGPALFNIFANNMDSGIEHTLRKFVNDTQLCSAVDMMEGRDSIWRDLDRLYRWTYANLMKLSKVKCKVLHIGQDNPKCKDRPDAEWLKTSPGEKDLGMFMNEKLNMIQQCALATQKANYVLHCVKSGKIFIELIEYPDLERTHMDFRSPVPGPVQDNPKNHTM